MSLEQTSQLIQLVLNSMLLIVSCALVSNRLGTRRELIQERLQSLAYQGAEWRGGDRALLRQLRQLHDRYRLAHYSLQAVHGALLLAIAQGLLLGLRLLVELDGLIFLALGLFVLSVALLLLAIGLTLIELQRSDRALWQEMRDLLSLSNLEKYSSGPRSRRVRGERSVQKAIPSRPPLRARVG